jgi:hypothetical protein
MHFADSNKINTFLINIQELFQMKLIVGAK